MNNRKINYIIKNSYNFSETGKNRKDSRLTHLCVIAIIIFLATLMPENLSAQDKKKASESAPAPTEIKKSDVPANVIKNKDSKDNPKKDNGEQKLTEKQIEADNKRADIIEKTIKYGTYSEIKDAILQIKTIKNESRKSEISKLLVPMLEDNNTEYSVLIKICYESEKLKLTDGIPHFVKLLKYQNEDVRIAALYALKDLKASNTKSEITAVFKEQDLSKDSNFISTLLDTMAGFEVNTEFQYIKEKIDDKNTTKNNKLALIKFLGDSKTEGAKDMLRKFYTDPDEDLSIRSYSVNALAKLDAKEARPDINKVIEEIDSYSFEKKKKYNMLYSYSITALSKLGDEKVFEKLQKAMKSDNAGVRLQAINLLKDLKDQRAIDILKYKAEYDENPKVQAAATEALKDMGIELENKDDKTNKKKNQKSKTGSEEKKNDKKEENKGINDDKNKQ